MMLRRKKSRTEVADRSNSLNLILMRRRVLSLWKQRNSCRMEKKEASHPDSSRMKLLEVSNSERLASKEQRNPMNNSKHTQSKE